MTAPDARAREARTAPEATARAEARTASEPPLFDPAFVKRLDGLALLTQRALAGRYAGDRRSPRRGQSVEFADFRNYVRGDDLRLVDWKAYGRLERLFVKLFLEEQDTSVHVLVDTSRSMGWGAPSKHWWARRLAGGLAYLALRGGDRVDVYAVTDRLVRSGPHRGREKLWQVWDFLNGLSAEGLTDFDSAFSAFAGQHSGQGLTFVVSDFLTPEGYQDGLRALQAAGQEVTVIQVLSPEDRSPELGGDLRLIDSETGHVQEVTITGPMLDRYQEALQGLQDELRGFCHRRGIGFHVWTTDLPVEDALLGWLPGAAGARAGRAGQSAGGGGGGR